VYTDSYGRLCGDGPVPQRGGDICSTLAGQQLCENGRCVSTADGSSFRCECLQGYKPSPGETTRCTGARSTPQHSVCLSVCLSSAIILLLLLLLLLLHPFNGLLSRTGWLGSRVVSVLDSGAEWPAFKSQSRRCRVTVLGKLFTPIVPLFNKQQNW